MTRRAPFAALVVALTLTLGLPAVAAPLSFPTRIEDGFPREGPPVITAQAWILYDESSDTMLASQAPTQQRAIASTTKIMTGLLVVEHGGLGDLTRISQRAADTGEREIGLVAGESVTVGALLKAAMIHSANDAATALAEHVGGSVEGFVELMNQRARELGLTETHFTNPHGLDNPDHYSSARDLLELTRVAMEHQQFADVVRSRMVVFPDAPDGAKRVGTSTNLLIGDYEGAGGVKTGFTSQALLTFVGMAERDGRRLYAIVLGSEGRRAHFSDATALFDYGFEELGVYGTLSTGLPYVTLSPNVQPSPLVAATNLETFVHLAGQGLMTDPPTPLVTDPGPTPTPITVVRRQADSGPRDLLEALGFWWRSLIG